MKKQLSFGIMTILLAMILGACGGNTTPYVSSSSSKAPTSSRSSSSKPSSTSQAPTKGISDLSISLGNEGDKAYITVQRSVPHPSKESDSCGSLPATCQSPQGR